MVHIIIVLVIDTCLLFKTVSSLMAGPCLFGS